MSLAGQPAARGADSDTSTDTDMEEEAPAATDNQLLPGEQPEQFDINLAATHSYMSELVPVRGCAVLEAGWRGSVPCVGHAGVLFPGETVPLMLQHQPMTQFQKLLEKTMFGLVFADETGLYTCGYGVLCEVFEATNTEQHAALMIQAIYLKARTRQRFKFVDMPKKQLLTEFTIDDMRYKLKTVNIQILPEATFGDPLYNSRFLSLDNYRGTQDKVLHKRLRRRDAMVTIWPLFVYEMRDFEKANHIIHRYYKELNYENLPPDAKSLSFWVASNLPVPYKSKITLFTSASTLERLWMEADLITRINVLCCSGCGDKQTPITKRCHAFAMSSEGLKSNYCNMYGYLHNIMTVRDVTNVRLTGAASSECSWFPGYMWTIAVCLICDRHIGWRFTAERPNLRPQYFYGINQNNVCSVLLSQPVEIR